MGQIGRVLFEINFARSVRAQFKFSDFEIGTNVLVRTFRIRFLSNIVNRPTLSRVNKAQTLVI